jgi:hypothetical protein
LADPAEFRSLSKTQKSQRQCAAIPGLMAETKQMLPSLLRHATQYSIQS